MAMNKPKLLVVDDDAALSAQYRWAFPNCRVVQAANRMAALAAAEREHPAAVLLDLGLPPDAEGVAEGFATLAGLRRISPGMPVVVVSGQGQRECSHRKQPARPAQAADDGRAVFAEMDIQQFGEIGDIVDDCRPKLS
jgi:CheY-like chemotaxis protein